MWNLKNPFNSKLQICLTKICHFLTKLFSKVIIIMFYYFDMGWYKLIHIFEKDKSCTEFIYIINDLLSCEGISWISNTSFRSKRLYIYFYLSNCWWKYHGAIREIVWLLTKKLIVRMKYYPKVSFFEFLLIMAEWIYRWSRTWQFRFLPFL